MEKIEANGLYGKIADEIMNLVLSVPSSKEIEACDPKDRSSQLIESASWRCGVVSFSLAIPPGPLGFVTILPDLVAIWKMQAQLVSDIAAAYGYKAVITREQMVYCLFRHAAAQALRDIAVRVGGRFMIKRVALRNMQTILEKIGIRVTQRVIGNTASRFVPFVGALAVGAYAKYDTKKVGETAVELFSELKNETMAGGE